MTVRDILFAKKTIVSVSLSGWILTLSNNTDDIDTYLTGVCIDNSSNLYCAGFDFTSDIGLYVKIDSAGSLQFAKDLNSGTHSIFSRISKNSLGDIYAVGQISNAQTWIAKFDTSGNYVSSRFISVPSWFNGTAGDVVFDNSNNMYVASGGNSTPHNIVTKYNSSDVQQSVILQTTSESGYLSIGIDGSNNLYLGSTKQDDIEPVFYSVIEKRDSSGTLVWQRTLGATALYDYRVQNNQVVVDFTGNTYVAGFVRQVADPYSVSAIIYKYDLNGNLLWQRILSNPQSYNTDVEFTCIHLGSDNNLYVGGYAYDGNDFSKIAIICKYDTSGNLQWQRSLSNTGGSPNDVIFGITTDSTYLYAVGRSYPGSFYLSLAMKLPLDGTLTGTHGSFTYAASTFTDSAGSFNSISTTPTDGDGSSITTPSTPTHILTTNSLISTLTSF